MAFLLISGGLFVLKSVRHSGKCLAGAWGLFLLAGSISFLGHVNNFDNATHGNIDQIPLTYLIGFSLVFCAIGFLLSLSGAKQND